MVKSMGEEKHDAIARILSFYADCTAGTQCIGVDMDCQGLDAFKYLPINITSTLSLFSDERLLKEGSVAAVMALMLDRILGASTDETIEVHTAEAYNRGYFDDLPLAKAAIALALEAEQEEFENVMAIYYRIHIRGYFAKLAAEGASH